MWFFKEVLWFRDVSVCYNKSLQYFFFCSNLRHWLKAVVSLTVVMGITWIIGVLVIKVEELCPLAYIFTIFVAFQGLFIFVIFVLLSKQVKENYAKWWKAKVAESDFLSKHFGEKSLSSSAVVRRINLMRTSHYVIVCRWLRVVHRQPLHLLVKRVAAMGSVWQAITPTRPVPWLLIILTQTSASCHWKRVVKNHMVLRTTQVILTTTIVMLSLYQ